MRGMHRVNPALMQAETSHVSQEDSSKDNDTYADDGRGTERGFDTEGVASYGGEHGFDTESGGGEGGDSARPHTLPLHTG